MSDRPKYIHDCLQGMHESLDSLASLAMTQGKEERFQRIIELVDLPTAHTEGRTISIETLLKVRDSSETRESRLADKQRKR
jgi:hypothetical protein